MTQLEYNSIKASDNTTVVLNFGDSKYHDALVHAYKSIDSNSIIDDKLLRMYGMSGVYYRSFINNLIRNISDPRYLEVGSWSGSTACSVMSNNTCKVTCIDNWSQFGGPKQKFLDNIKIHKNESTDFTFIESNFYNVDYTSLGKYNVYMFDGPHGSKEQFDGIEIAQPALDDVYIQIVDDWNGPGVRSGTLKAFEKLKLKVLESIEIRTSQDGTHGEPRCHNSQWHNGYYITVVQRNV